MDVGVGSFVFSLGIVSVRSFAKAQKEALSTMSAVLRALRKASPVLALGVIRVLMVKGSEYPVSYPSKRWFMLTEFVRIVGACIRVRRSLEFLLHPRPSAHFRYATLVCPAEVDAMDHHGASAVIG